MCTEVVESQERIIELSEQRLAAEKKEKARLLQEMQVTQSEGLTDKASSSYTISGDGGRSQDGFRCQNNIGITVSQVVNMYASQPIPGGTVIGGPRTQQSMLAPPIPQPGVSGRCPETRSNSWFRAPNFHAGGDVPAGRTTPEFWDGQWEGIPTPMMVPESPIPRSAMSKHARGEKKKNRQAQISAKAEGCAWNEPTLGNDTMEKKKLRANADEILDILRNRKVEYGFEPERAFSTEVVDCAKLGSRF